MATEVFPFEMFQALLAQIRQETDSAEKKLEILFCSRGFFNAEQAMQILYAFAIPADKVRAIKIMESRLALMNCSEARKIIEAMGIHNDRIVALECVKGVLLDSQLQYGIDMILSAFIFESDKIRAYNILQTVSSCIAETVPAGAHQGYAALGSLYIQSRPMIPHLYGTIEEQRKNSPGFGKIELSAQSKQGGPSLYTSHQSYAYPPGRNFATDRGYTGAHCG